MINQLYCVSEPKPYMCTFVSISLPLCLALAIAKAHKQSLQIELLEQNGALIGQTYMKVHSPLCSRSTVGALIMCLSNSASKFSSKIN